MAGLGSAAYRTPQISWIFFTLYCFGRQGSFTLPWNMESLSFLFLSPLKYSRQPRSSRHTDRWTQGARCRTGETEPSPLTLVLSFRCYSLLFKGEAVTLEPAALLFKKGSVIPFKTQGITTENASKR